MFEWIEDKALAGTIKVKCGIMVYADEKAAALLAGDVKVENCSVEKVLPGFIMPDTEDRLNHQVLQIKGRKLDINSIAVSLTDGLVYVFISEIIEKTIDEQDIENVIKNIHKNPHILGAIVRYIFDDVIIVDGQGVLRWRVPNYKELYGIEEEILGKTIFEIEKLKAWYPSASVKAFREKRRVTLVNRFKNKTYHICTAIPIINAENEIEGLISYSNDISEFMEIKKQYAKLEILMARYFYEIEALRKKDIHFPEIIRKSSQMKNLIELSLKVAPADVNLLITGESGVGKNLMANFIHQNSDRAKGPFIEINCGAIPENLLESELFGYVAGAFTGAGRKGKIGMIETANGGTLFLDEIGELPLNLQVKLLKVIQSKTLNKIGDTQPVKVDFRLIAATNKDLKSHVKSGIFREDLYYRINVVALSIPPIRDRKDDIFPLIIHFLNQANKKFGKNRTLSNDTVDALMNYDWPGNVRELNNIIERVVITADRDSVSPAALPDNIKYLNTASFVSEGTLKFSLERLEAQIVKDAYARYRTTIGVGKALGISQASSVRKLQKYIDGYST